MSIWKMLLALPIVVAASQLVQTAHSQTQDWPNRPVKIIVPFAPGGNADGMARIIGQRLGDVLGQNFVVENRTGAGGTIAVQDVARSPADGYTLLWGVQPQIVIIPAMQKVTYDPVKDLAPISVLATNPFVLVANGKLPVKTVAEFVDLGESAAGQAQLWLERDRQRGAARHGAVPQARRARHDAGALSRQCAGAGRRGGGPCAGDVLQPGRRACRRRRAATCGCSR